MDNEMYDEINSILQKLKKIRDSHMGMPGKPLTDEERKELKELRGRLEELDKEDEKAREPNRARASGNSVG